MVGIHTEIRLISRMNYQQEYIEHGYKELIIPASPDESFVLDPHHLHIWPRRTFMLIALPNSDKSFTCTLFMSLDQFDKLQTPSDLLDFFKKQFPDILSLIGQDRLIHDFFSNPTGSLMSIKVGKILTI